MRKLVLAIAIVIVTVAVSVIAGLLMPLGLAHAKTRIPTVLVLPGGGWQTAHCSGVATYIRQFHARGIQAICATYPLRNISAAQVHIDHLIRAYRRHGPVATVGISAGGLHSASAGARALVDLSVNALGPTDLNLWATIPAGRLILPTLNMAPRAMRAASPYHQLRPGRRPARHLSICGSHDTLVPWRTQCARFVARSRAVGGTADLRLAPIEHHVRTESVISRVVAWIAHRLP